MLSFRKVEIGDYDRIQKFFSRYGENSCQHSFINLFTYNEKYGAQFCEQDGFLYIWRSRRDSEGVRTYLFPMGEKNWKEAVEQILLDAHAHGAKACFWTVTESKCQWLLKEFPGVFEAREERDYAEYLHRTENLAALPGRKFSQKRSDANLMRRTYAGRMEESALTRKHIGEVLAFAEKWYERSRETHDAEALTLEYHEMQLQLAFMEELRITGLLLWIDGEIQGFVYGAPISGDCYDVLMEKGNRDIAHIYRVLHQDIARFCAKGYSYINREEDVGVPGLRQSKMSYRPDILLRKYTVREI